MAPPDFWFISQDGPVPSGVSSYGFQLLTAYAGARMFLLNADVVPSWAPLALKSRIICVSESESHDVAVVARRLRALFDTAAGNVLVLPNTGDTPWSATVAWLSGLSPAERMRARVLGILHSDVESQFAVAHRHLGVAPVWTAVSRRCAHELRQRFAGANATVHELHLPMPVAEHAAEERCEGPLRLIYVGRLEEPQKRVSRLAAVLASLARYGVEFEATIAGDGPARAEFAAAIERGPAARHVKLVGAVDRATVQSLLLKSDVFVLTSAYEGLPLALLEAMAAGVCPVVMQIQSGLEDSVTADENALVIPQGETDAMALAIRALDRDRQRLELLKRAARARIHRDFSPEQHFQRFESIARKCFQLSPPEPGSISNDPAMVAVGQLVHAAGQSGKPLAVYGTGMFGRKVLDALLGAELRVVALFDSDPARHGRSYRGLVCASPDEMVRFADTVFVVGSIEFASEIADRIRTTFSAAHVPPSIVTCLR